METCDCAPAVCHPAGGLPSAAGPGRRARGKSTVKHGTVTNGAHLPVGIPCGAQNTLELRDVRTAAGKGRHRGVQAILEEAQSQQSLQCLRQRLASSPGRGR